jgi:hypothetical protein
MSLNLVTKLIRDKASKSFFTEDGAWTDDPRAAWHLGSSLEAHMARRQFNLRNVELYYCYEDEQTSSWDFVVPLD